MGVLNRGGSSGRKLGSANHHHRRRDRWGIIECLSLSSDTEYKLSTVFHGLVGDKRGLLMMDRHTTTPLMLDTRCAVVAWCSAIAWHAGYSCFFSGKGWMKISCRGIGVEEVVLGPPSGWSIPLFCLTRIIHHTG